MLTFIYKYSISLYSFFNVSLNRGVVQLFGAFEKHHKSLKMKLAETRSELQREKVLEKVGKNEFLEILWNEGKKGNRRDDNTNSVKDVSIIFI